ncbi:hypothetical protein CPB83DRAFT_895212 [Crepidotus variabilis]|uniref:Uncharacterized protein n=1 Tax=Crepidotus variabilis TaxID=179855 RepID=A0A9P6JP34_9AGAR|nr:hypothetical protein CPB83DRAFT_895212 [Crepidotus variabilis]
MVKIITTLLPRLPSMALYAVCTLATSTTTEGQTDKVVARQEPYKRLSMYSVPRTYRYRNVERLPRGPGGGLFRTSASRYSGGFMGMRGGFRREVDQDFYAREIANLEKMGERDLVFEDLENIVERQIY